MGLEFRWGWGLDGFRVWMGLGRGGTGISQDKGPLWKFLPSGQFLVGFHVET